MIYTVLDRSNYLKGLLILARQDKRLLNQEKDYIRDIAKKFGFSRDFYEDTLKSLMMNKYIKEDPITFSAPSVAESFINDGLNLALSDNELDEKELVWLKKIAEANSINQEKFQDLISNHLVKSNDKPGLA